MKLAVIGGGSTYTPELVDGIARLTGDIKITELVLADPDAERLAVVGPFSARIMARYGHPAAVSWTADVDAAVDGAAAVLLQLRVGGQATRHRDETWPLECGCIGQETTGAGGFAKALRTVPVVLDVAERVRQRALPDAWIIDFTNPVGIVTRALLDAGHRAIGLCNVAIGYQRLFASLLDVAPERVALDHVGLNHLTWERAALLDGQDRLPGLLDAHGEEIALHTGQPLAATRLAGGAVPSYYLRYFWAHDAVVAEERGQQTRAQAVAKIERQLLAMYADPVLDTKPDLLTHRGGAFYSEAAVALLASLITDAGDRQVVNVRNHGTLPFLADEAVIEVSATIGAGGAVPVPVTPVSPLMSGLIAHVSAYEHLAVDAALHGGRDRVLRAMLAHPLIGQLDLAGPADRPAAGAERRVPAVGQVSAAVGALAAVLAVDGGNSKTDVALIGQDGSVLAAVRGGPSNHQIIGVDQASAVLVGLVREAAGQAGLPAVGQVAAHTSACLAGADLPVEEADLSRLVQSFGWSPSNSVVNDTFAVLRAGLADNRPHWGIAVVCGAGINCVGVGPDGAMFRFLALGELSGDWGGGGEIGPQALWWAMRAEDGRGPETALRTAVPAHFGLQRVEDVVVGLHLGKIGYEERHRLVPVLFEVAEHGDQVARDVLARQAEEICLMAEVAARNLGLAAPGPGPARRRGRRLG